LVFTPKYRRGVFTDEILIRCKEIMSNVCADFGGELREFNGEADHAHLLVHYPPQVSLSRLVNSLKGVSSRHLRREFSDHVRRYPWATTSGHRPTSQPPAAAHPWPSSSSTSRTSDTQTELTAPKRRDTTDRIPPGRERPGFLRFAR
jgi:hypothetical protein